MKTLIFASFIVGVSLSTVASDPNFVAQGKIPIAVVRHQTRVKIIESNNVSIRTGSVYDNITYFESHWGFRPKFLYEFIDTGLGSAEPLYPNYQAGYQASWWQLIPAFFSEKMRHIDHYTSLPTPEGCHVDSAYMLRHIDEFSEDQFAVEREEGYDLIVIRLEYYTRMHEDAQCGRHKTNAPDPKFKPMKFMKKYKRASSLADFPQEHLHKFEAKVSAIYHIDEEMNRNKWPRFDEKKLDENYLWYYPNGYEEDYGLKDEFMGIRASDTLFGSQEDLVQAYTLEKMLSETDFNKLLDFMDAKPTKGFNPMNEPGNDALKFADITNKYYYTAGLNMYPIENAFKDVSRRHYYRLAGISIKAFEEETDIHFPNGKAIPQVRYVYQLMNPNNRSEAVEQLYIHLNFDAIDRFATPNEQRAQITEFAQDLAGLAANKSTQNKINFLDKYSKGEAVNVSFSSSLTGIWIFGSLSRNFNAKRDLEAVRIIRQGVDLGYYSSVYDNDLFRDAIAAEVENAEDLQDVLDDITVTTYRDPKREDVNKLRFHRVSCAQCHQMSGRDGVHMAINDGLDRRIQYDSRITKFDFLESEYQLKLLQDYIQNQD